jgi:mRNA interferase YafQ
MNQKNLMEYEVKTTKLFKRQYKRVLRQGKSKNKIERVIHCLANHILLANRFKVHRLRGKYMGKYELHIEPNLILIYEYRHEVSSLYLLQIGSHSELFE